MIIDAFLVFGPESSGTRLATSILISGGCLGSAEHEQEFDKYDREDFHDLAPIVWRRSFPHNEEWPILSSLVRKLSGYSIHIIVTTRDWHCMVESQLNAPHVDSREEAIVNIRSAYYSIFSQISKTNIPFTLFSYESLISNPVLVQRRLLKDLGLQQIVRLDIYDGNEKYLGRHE